MTDPKITYHVLFDTDPSDPGGIVRRIHFTPPRDETFGRDLSWHPTEYLQRYYMRGTHDIEHEEITPDEAEAILDRWRTEWTQEDDNSEAESS